jgi:hypothetical protein
MMWINIIILFFVSVAAAILAAFVLKIDLRGGFGVGLTIGLWLFAVGAAAIITSASSGIYYFFKRKRMPGLFVVLWLSWIICASYGFIGYYNSPWNKGGGGTNGNEEQNVGWLYGKWGLAYDPDNSPKDYVVFKPGGEFESISHKRTVKGHYELSRGKIKVSVYHKNKHITLPLGISPDKSRLTVKGGAYYTKEVAVQGPKIDRSQQVSKENFKSWALKNTPVIRLRYVADGEIWVVLPSDKCGSLNEVQQIADDLAKAYRSQRAYTEPIEVTVWDTNKQMKAIGRCP